MKTYKISAFFIPDGLSIHYGVPTYYLAAESMVEAANKFKSLSGDKNQDPHQIEELGEFIG